MVDNLYFCIFSAAYHSMSLKITIAFQFNISSKFQTQNGKSTDQWNTCCGLLAARLVYGRFELYRSIIPIHIYCFLPSTMSVAFVLGS